VIKMLKIVTLILSDYLVDNLVLVYLT